MSHKHYFGVHRCDLYFGVESYIECIEDLDGSLERDAEVFIALIA